MCFYVKIFLLGGGGGGFGMMNDDFYFKFYLFSQRLWCVRDIIHHPILIEMH